MGCFQGNWVEQGAPGPCLEPVTHQRHIACITCRVRPPLSAQHQSREMSAVPILHWELTFLFTCTQTLGSGWSLSSKGGGEGTSDTKKGSLLCTIPLHPP